MIAKDKPQIPDTLKGDIALLTVTTYDDWLNKISYKTRKNIRASTNKKVKTTITLPNEELAIGICKIYNETPIRQNRKFQHYGATLETVRRNMYSSKGVFICSTFNNEIIGFAEIEQVGVSSMWLISQILGSQKHRDKRVGNALMAEIVRCCAENRVNYLVYARFGNHPSLDEFKRKNRFELYHVAGHSKLIDFTPRWCKRWVIPIYNWVSRVSVRLKLFIKMLKKS